LRATGNGKTTVLDLVTTQPSQTVMAIDESLLHGCFHLSASVLPKRWITSAITSFGLGFPLLTIGIMVQFGLMKRGVPTGVGSPKGNLGVDRQQMFAAYLHARITRGWQGRRPPF